MKIDQGNFSSRSSPLKAHPGECQESTVLPLHSSQFPATNWWLCLGKQILRWVIKERGQWANNSGKQSGEVNVGLPVCKKETFRGDKLYSYCKQGQRISLLKINFRFLELKDIINSDSFSTLALSLFKLDSLWPTPEHASIFITYFYRCNFSCILLFYPDTSHVSRRCHQFIYQESEVQRASSIFWMSYN